MSGFQVSDWPPLRNTVVHACDNARPHVVTGVVQVDFTDAYARIAELRKATRVALSYHSFVLGCLAKAASGFPMLHAMRQGKKLITFDSIDMGTIIDQHANDKHRTRLPVVSIVRDADRKSMAQINWEIRAAARKDLGKNPDVKHRRGLTRYPYPLQKILFRRLMRDPIQHRKFFGTMGFTSVQTPGYNYPSYAFVPALNTTTVAMGNIHQVFLPDANGQPTLRRVLDLSATFDHDFVDGMLISAFGMATGKLIEGLHGLDDEYIRETREFHTTEKAAKS